MVCGTFVQGEANIYTNPPADYQMYCRVEKEKSHPAVSVQIELPVTGAGAFIQGEAAEIYTNPPANYQMYPRKPAAYSEDNKPSLVAPLTPTTVASYPNSPKTDFFDRPASRGSMIGAAFVQGGAADIYTNPPANYQMYPRKLAAAPEEKKTPASAALTPAKVTCQPKTIEASSAMIGGAFIQGEAAEIYTNPPANYQMYPRNSLTGVEPQDLGTVGAWDLEEAEEWEVKKVHQRQESKSTVASDSDMLLAAP